MSKNHNRKTGLISPIERLRRRFQNGIGMHTVLRTQSVGHGKVITRLELNDKINWKTGLRPRSCQTQYVIMYQRSGSGTYCSHISIRTAVCTVYRST
jgi:hypothetical protein